jgi:hypothetical protein
MTDSEQLRLLPEGLHNAEARTQRPGLQLFDELAHCASVSRRGCPNRFGRLSASMPPSCPSFSHRDAEVRVRPTRRATSACAIPDCSKRAGPATPLQLDRSVLVVHGHRE